MPVTAPLYAPLEKESAEGTEEMEDQERSEEIEDSEGEDLEEIQIILYSWEYPLTKST